MQGSVLTKQFKLVPQQPWCFSIRLVRSICVFAFIISFVSGCWSSDYKGTLIVSAEGKGRYEIFKIASDRPLQLVSEIVGNFNKPVKLDPGRYLVFADCSSETVVIKSGREKHLVADTMAFKAPKDVPRGKESFIIQCTRHEQTQTRQRLINQFKLRVLRGNWEILIGMISLRLPTPSKKHETDLTPQRHDFNLAALQVASYEGSKGVSRFFVSPVASLVSLTESQMLGDWLFLLPGKYNVELNGSALEVDLLNTPALSLGPAFIRVVTPDGIDLDLAQNIQGNPLFVEINGSHWLNLNETYPVLPGPLSLRLVGSETEHHVVLQNGETLEKKARSVLVALHCPPWDWTCLGSRRIYLYSKDAHYPFAQGITDVPLLYFEDEAWLTIEGSREIRNQLSKDKLSTTLKTATVRVIPQLEFRPSVITDLVRVEATGSQNTGNTLDLSLEDPSTLYLLPGVYNLAQYNLTTTSDGERRKTTRRLELQENEHQDLGVIVHLSEKRIKNMAQKSSKQQTEKRLARRRFYTQKYRTATPLGFL